MSGRVLQRLTRRASEDSGYTLIETIVTSMLFLIASSLMLGLFAATTNTSRRVRAAHDINEEGRNAINRMARELRQATQTTYVVNPDGTYSPSALTAISFRADFNGDGCAGNSCVGTDVTTNPETLTYCFNPSDPDPVQRTYLWLIPSGLTATPTSCATAGAQPILAGHVNTFKLLYRSNDYRQDDSPSDGVTTWQELDDAPPPIGDIGGSDGNINTPLDPTTGVSTVLAHVNSIGIELSLSLEGKQQKYVTQVNLRNRP